MTEPRLALNYAASSDRGLVRQNNEDSAYAGPHVLALADGMGGHAAGEVASAFLIESLSALDKPELEEPGNNKRLTTMLAKATEEGNQHIASHVDENPQLQGMGCTLTSLIKRGSQAAICHVGDSRAYLLRDGEFTQLTKDDTFVQSLVDEGKLDPSDASSHPQRSLILKALTGRPVEPTLTDMELRAGDRIMLCSDGLSDPVSSDTMREILPIGDPGKAANKLVEMALRGGGPDNVTVIVADVVDEAAAADDPDETDDTTELPDKPVVVGAAAPEPGESQWFDTPAARAAASGASVTSTWETRARATTDPKDADGDADAVAAQITPEPPHDGGAPTKKKKKKTGWIAGIVALIVIVGLIAGGVAGYKYLSDTYYVAVEDNQIVVKNGMDGSVLGMSLNSTHQQVCLNEKSEVQLVAVDSDDADNCHLFDTADLNPSARSTIESMPEDGYQEIVDQINRLAEQTLPVCVTRSPEKGKSGSSDSKDSADKKTSKDSKDDEAKSSDKPRDTKGSDAPEDLTTPGVSCREVK